MNDEDRKRIGNLLDLINRFCQSIAIANVPPQIKKAVACVRLLGGRDELRFHVKSVSDRIKDELGTQKFLHIPPRRCDYYEDISWLGSHKTGTTDKVIEDLTREATCFALGQDNVSVFHQMRLLENLVQQFGRKLKVQIKVKEETWHEIMLHVHGKVGQLPGGQRASSAQNRRKQSFALAASRLDHVRIVWRNEAMHPKATYDESDA